MTNEKPNYLMASVILTLLSLSITPSFGAINSEKVVGAAACYDCHISEYEGWQATAHFKAYNTLHRSSEARDIAGKLNIKGNLRRASRCMTCHYTTQGAKPRAIAGNSCESCHGAAKDWLDLHSEPVPEPGYTLAKTEEAGMIRPHRLYRVAENCYQCHTVRDEELVNTGEHSAGSAFELVAWLQGEVRHNFFISEGEENRRAPQELNPAHHLRVLYVMGRILDLEYSLRAAALATQPGVYADAMKKHVEDARARLEEIQKRGGNPGLTSILKSMLDAAGQVGLEPNNGPALETAAETVKEAAQRFGSGYDGSKLAGLDPLLPKTYKGTVYKGN